jgi:hypothetical protein
VVDEEGQEVAGVCEVDTLRTKALSRWGGRGRRLGPVIGDVAMWVREENLLAALLGEGLVLIQGEPWDTHSRATHHISRLSLRRILSRSMWASRGRRERRGKERIVSKPQRVDLVLREQRGLHRMDQLGELSGGGEHGKEGRVTRRERVRGIRKGERRGRRRQNLWKSLEDWMGWSLMETRRSPTLIDWERGEPSRSCVMTTPYDSLAWGEGDRWSNEEEEVPPSDARGICWSREMYPRDKRWGKLSKDTTQIIAITILCHTPAE